MKRSLSHFLMRVDHRPYFFSVGVFIILRVWLSLWASVSVVLLSIPIDKVKLYYGMTPLNSLLWSPWQRWDTIWYTKIAEQGYSPSDLSTAFFPLFPLLIRMLAPVLGNGVAAGVVIASIATAFSFVLLFKLARDYFGHVAANRTVLYLATFPAAFFLFAAYTESLFLALALACFLCARSRRWELVGILAALTGMTRPQGLLIVLPLAIEFFQQYRRGEVAITRALNLGIAIAGGLAFPSYLAMTLHDPFAFLHVQSFWRRPALPWESLVVLANVVIHSKSWIELAFSLPDLAFTLLFLCLTGWSIFRLPAELSAYMAVVVIPPLFGITTYEPLLPLASMARYALVAFPGFILLGQIPLSGRWLILLVVPMLLIQTVELILFAAWIFVG